MQRISKVFLLLSLTLAGGCSQDFDERYAETQKQVKAKEVRIDKAAEKQALKEAGER